MKLGKDLLLLGFFLPESKWSKWTQVTGDGRIKVSMCVHSLCNSSVIKIIAGDDCTHVHYFCCKIILECVMVLVMSTDNIYI